MQAQQIYHILKGIVETIHSQDEQLVAIAKWIESEFTYKPDHKLEKAAPEMLNMLIKARNELIYCGIELEIVDKLGECINNATDGGFGNFSDLPKDEQLAELKKQMP